MADSVLLIDDDADLLKALGDYFDHLGYEVAGAATGAAGLESFGRLRPDVVILDLHLPDGGGLDLLERLHAQGGAVILLTGRGDTATAVRAMQLGAEHFLTKPVDFIHLAAAAARVGEKVRLGRANQMLRAQTQVPEGLDALGVSPAMGELARQVELLAASDHTTVLLTGESGTGKGWVARLLHRRGRAAGAFVEVNCGALSATGLDAELFGYENGADTDARQRRPGLFELADHGTIFLDEIGELALELQPKLLTVLETKTVRRLGGSRALTVDVRLIAATHRDLLSDVKAGRFREDLYDRLSVRPIHLPAVRERAREDRLALLTRLLAALHVELSAGPRGCTAEALERLLAAPWPGNIREMRNVLERAMIVGQGAPAIGVEHLPADLRKSGPGGAGGGGSGGGERRHVPQTLAEVERLQIEKSLRFHAGNRTRSAQELGISRATLINKIKTYGLDL